VLHRISSTDREAGHTLAIVGTHPSSRVMPGHGHRVGGHDGELLLENDDAGIRRDAHARRSRDSLPSAPGRMIAPDVLGPAPRTVCSGKCALEIPWRGYG
jgi:hypothetical protein